MFRRKKMEAHMKQIPTEVPEEEDEKGGIEAQEQTQLTRSGSSNDRRTDNSKPRNVITQVCLFILVTEMCERLAFYGFSGTLLSFFTSQLGLNSVFASELTALFAAIVHLTPVLGGWIADQYLNRYRTIGTFLVVYVIGLAMVALAAWPQTNSLPLALFGLLGFVAVGAGGIKANVVTFGADQFDMKDARELKQQERFFGYFYMTINIGAIVSFGFLSNLSFNPEFFSGGLIPEEYGYFATYVIPLVFLLLASCIFFVGTPRYRINPASGSAFNAFTTAFVRSCRRDKTGVGRTLLRVLCTLGLSACMVVGSFFVVDEKINYAMVTIGMVLIVLCALFLIIFCQRVDWLDKVSLMTDSGLRLDASAISNVRDMILLLPYFGLLVMFFVGYAQMTGNFQLQACQMNTFIGSVLFSPAFLNTFDCMAIIIAVPLLNRIVYPSIERVIQRKVRPLERMFWGFLCMAMAMLAAGVIEDHRIAADDLAVTMGFTEGVHPCCGSCMWASTRNGGCPGACGNVTVPFGSGETALAWKSCKYNSLCGGYKPMKDLTVWYQLGVFVLVGLGETFSSVAAYDLFYNEVGKDIRSVSQGINLMTYAFGSFAAGGLNGLFQDWLPDNLNESGAHLNRIFYCISLLTLTVSLAFKVISRSYVYRSDRKPSSPSSKPKV